VQRLDQNQNGYRGERIDVDATLDACRAAAHQHGWSPEPLPPAELNRCAWVRRTGRAEAHRIYLSTGMHGDEPAGPSAALQLLRENRWPDVDLWLLPCLNPTGLRANSRTNAAGIDVNRDYRQPRSAEAQGHLTWLEQQPRFDLALLLHEDWEAHGFYCYELNPHALPSLAGAMVNAVRAVCPIDESPEIDGRPISEPGIIRPLIEAELRPDWPEALWLGQHKTSLSYTLEAPSDWPLPVRVKALVTAVQAALAQFTATDQPSWAALPHTPSP
jgi:hypothetical protein